MGMRGLGRVQREMLGMMFGGDGVGSCGDGL